MTDIVTTNKIRTNNMRHSNDQYKIESNIIVKIFVYKPSGLILFKRLFVLLMVSC